LNDSKEETIICSYQKSKKKIIKRNGKSYERFSDHIGSIPLVIISPTDRDLIIEGSQMRRKFMDSVISQSDKQYLHNVIAYNKVLSQRNALLKYFAKNRTFDLDTLTIYNQQLIDYANQIHKTRTDFVTRIRPIFLKHYKSISNGEEKVDLIYSSHLNEKPLATLLEQSLERDKILQYTAKGVHRDDLNFEIDEFPIK
jgi:DNA replication and repair protein RecF